MIFMNRLFMFLFVSCIAIHFVIAQHTNIDTINLNAVTITSQKVNKSDISPTPMQIIKAEDIQRISGLGVSDAVRLFSGIAMKDYGGVGGMKTVMVRSLGANHTSVFVDGVKINDIASGQIDLGKMLLFNTKEITLNIGHSYNTCKPASYYSSASVISINSALPDTSRKNELYLGYKAGSWNLSNPYISLHNRVSRLSNVAIVANMIKSDGNYPYKIKYGSLKDSILHRENSDLTVYQLHTNFITTFQDSSQLSLKVQYDESEKGLPGAIMLYNVHSKQRMWNKDLLTNIRYENHKSNRINYLFNTKYARSFLNYKDPNYLNNQS
jgi:vitamin B12 transporter